MESSESELRATLVRGALDVGPVSEGSLEVTGMRAKFSVATLSLLVLGVAACGSTSTPSSAGGAKTLSIAAIIDESGALGDRGTAAVDGIDLAVKEINKAGGFKVGGVTYTLALQSQDTAGSPSTATAETVKAVSDDGIKFIFGGIGDETAPMAQTTQSSRSNILYADDDSRGNLHSRP